MDKVCKFDATYKAKRESKLKYQMARAVKDIALQREIRRLNVDTPELSYFEMRDRVIQGLGRPTENKCRAAVVSEV